MGNWIPFVLIKWDFLSLCLVQRYCIPFPVLHRRHLVSKLRHLGIIWRWWLQSRAQRFVASICSSSLSTFLKLFGPSPILSNFPVAVHPCQWSRHCILWYGSHKALLKFREHFISYLFILSLISFHSWKVGQVCRLHDTVLSNTFVEASNRF